MGLVEPMDIHSTLHAPGDGADDGVQGPIEREGDGKNSHGGGCSSKARKRGVVGTACCKEQGGRRTGCHEKKLC